MNATLAMRVTLLLQAATSILRRFATMNHLRALMWPLHRLSSTLNPVWHLTMPYKDLAYLKSYFLEVEQFRTNSRVRFHVQAVLVVIVLEMFQLVHLAVTPMPHLYRLLLLDYFYINHMPSEFNLMSVLLLGLAIYYYYMAYFRTHSKSFVYLANKVLISGEDDFFPQQYIKDVPVHQLVQRAGLVLLNVLQFFVFVTNLFILSTQVFITHQLYQNWAYFTSASPYWPLHLVLIQANAFLLYFALHALVHVCNLLGTVSIITAIICFIRFRQTAQILDRPDRQMHWHDLLHFRATHIASMQLFFPLSTIYGKLLAAFIAINCPLNSTILVALWIDRMPLVHRFFAAVILLGQSITLLGNHLVAAIFPKRIHQPIKRLIHFNVLARNSGTLRNKLKVAHCIEHFHTENEYGIQYGSLRLVTLLAFFKFLTFYVQVLMMCYQLIRGRHFYQ